MRDGIQVAEGNNFSKEGARGAGESCVGVNDWSFCRASEASFPLRMTYYLRPQAATAEYRSVERRILCRSRDRL